MVDVNTTHIAPCLHEEVITHLYCIHMIQLEKGTEITYKNSRHNI